jgi:hypothetical protein
MSFFVWCRARQITPEECQRIAIACQNLPGTVLGPDAAPVVIAGVKYMVLRADDNVFYVRQVSCVSRRMHVLEFRVNFFG